MILNTDMALMEVHMTALPGAAIPVKRGITIAVTITTARIGGIGIAVGMKEKIGALWIALLIQWLRGLVMKMQSVAGVWTTGRADSRAASTEGGARVATGARM